MKRYNSPYIILCCLAVLGIVFPASCAKIHINTIPLPPPTAKLRVYVQPLTGHGTWNTSHAEFVSWTTAYVERYLKETGIYEVASKEDVQTALNGQEFSRWSLEQNNWRLAKEIGRALHADYAMIIERDIGGGAGGTDFTIENVMINIKTGKKYTASKHLSRITRSDRARSSELVREAHRDIFRSAKQDMLATAIKKGKFAGQARETVAAGHSSAPSSTPTTVTRQKDKQPEIIRKSDQIAAVQKQDLQRPSPEATRTEKPTEPPRQPVVQKPGERGPAKESTDEKPAMSLAALAKGTKLAVFDLDSPENFRPVALILTEALREELFLLQKFTLVNREDLSRVLQETALQQSGLIDERQAIKTGKGLAANQVVTGRLGLLGKTYILQAKRVDVETLATLGLTSAKFSEGQEEEVLSKMKDLAKRLADSR